MSEGRARKPHQQDPNWRPGETYEEWIDRVAREAPPLPDGAVAAIRRAAAEYWANVDRRERDEE